MNLFKQTLFKSELRLILSLLLGLIFLSLLSPVSCLAFTLVIDPGHGGEDKGASQGSIMESKIALQVALKLAHKFTNDPNTRIILTRADDKSSLSLKDRVRANSMNKGDLFVSLHGNSSWDKRAKGAEFYFGVSRPPQKIAKKNPIDHIVKDLRDQSRLYQSQYLAADIFDIWKQSTFSSPRAIKQAPFYVINRNTTPSILVEFGFITNAKESLELLKDEKQELIAQNLYDAIKVYQENLERQN